MIEIPDTIFPTNEEGNKVCFKCRKTLNDCQCPSFDPRKPKLDQFVPVVRIDKSGRRGKTVTLIEGLPRDKDYLATLAKKFKSKTGSGGTFYLTEQSGIIEIQGDRQEVVKSILDLEFKQ